MIGISHDDVVENVDFKKLVCSDEVTDDFDVGLGWCRFADQGVISSRRVEICLWWFQKALWTYVVRHGRLKNSDWAQTS